MVFGKPGAGKTTFLKYLAMTCIQGENFSSLIPMFIDLKRFANSSSDVSLLSFMVQKFSECNLLEEQVSCLFENGKGLVLLDGLDEVKSEDSQRVLMQIEDFCDRYSQNLFVITCRIAAKDYVFRNFADVEMADFDDAQIQSFAEKWFAVNDSDLSARFLEEVKANSQIQELATSPLLLTLLCLEFEESGDFPSDRADLYDRALTTLLRQWDSKRGITRDQIYKSLSIKRKESLLSHIALTTFERKEFLFKQRDLERYISDYIRNFPEVSSDPEALQLDSEVVLKSIESQHGLLVERAKRVYSFSHFTFHEFLTAKQIVNIANPYSLEDQTLQMLASHVADKQWREIFLLTVKMIANADCLLLTMKVCIDKLILDSQLQEFLVWVNDKAQEDQTSYSKQAVRAF
jgi:predicted NACHT family NTPase